jgi:hypothetical protein
VDVMVDVVVIGDGDGDVTDRLGAVTVVAVCATIVAI